MIKSGLMGRRLLMASWVCLAALSGLALAQEKAPEPEKPKPEFPPFEKVAKDHELVAKESFYPLYLNKKDDHLLAVIPSNQLDKNFLVAASIGGGSRYTGFQWGHRVVRWERRGKKLLLIEPELRYKMGDGQPVGDAIRRTYTDSILLTTPIVSMKDGNPVIDLDNILKTGFGGVSRALGGSINSGLSKWAKIKAFENNLVLEVDAAIMQGNGGHRGLVGYSISELPQTDYKPRRADDRIGYFLTAIMDWTRDHNSDTLFDRYIHRWNLRKEDSTAEISDVKPEDQIIFYIEKTVPVQYRPYVREGILEWNKAFEKAGLRNAIAVLQQTDTVHADKDPEDVRYNFIRWIVSGRAFAMGPSRANPLTGEILDADILFDDSFIRALMKQYASLSAKGPAAAPDERVHAFLEAHPEWNFVPQYEKLVPGEQSVSGMNFAWDTASEDGWNDLNVRESIYMMSMAHEACFATSYMAAEGNQVNQEAFIGELLKELITHEVGHTLGLRHNFKASSWKSLDEILSNTDPDTPTCASVMDYIPALFANTPDDQKQFITTTIGPYDYWAIEYGYRQPAPDESEADMLKKITDRVAEEGLSYATDDDNGAFEPDPLVNVYDHGDDPVAYAKHRMNMVAKLRENLADWAVEDGESYNNLRTTLDMLLWEYNRCSRFAARTVGGMYVTRDHKGDPNARQPFTVVPVEKQREALQFCCDEVFSDKAFDFDPALLRKLAPGRWRHWDSDAYDSQLEYPVHDRVAAIQAWTLFQLTNPFTVTRIHDAELQVPADEDAMTLPELFRTITDSIWSELQDNTNGTFTNRKPMISSTRRNLQRRHLQMLENLVLSTPGGLMPADAHAVGRLILSDLSRRIGQTLTNANSIDDFSKAHLTDAKNRIDRALDADVRLR